MDPKPKTDHSSEVTSGRRFAFGRNWRSFLDTLNEKRILAAEDSLKELLQSEPMEGKRFIDIGSGSGLFSLAAMRLHASEVRSFDYDPASVECTRELKRRFFPDDPRWTITEGSVLDRDFLGRLGQFDVAYSWGVLHHTGNMRQAMENVRALVAPGGFLILAIYNNQGWKSRAWLFVKKSYCRTPAILRALLFPPIPLYFETKWMLGDLARGRVPFERWRTANDRGMSPYHDWIDWLGGYPFEVAKPEEVFAFYRARGFRLEKLVTCLGGLGNNEFVFRRALA